MSTPANSPTPRHRNIQRVFYVLAGFDVITALIGLTLLIVIANRFDRSRETNEFLADGFAQLAALRADAQVVNQHGNDRFLPPDQRVDLGRSVTEAARGFEHRLDGFRAVLERAAAERDDLRPLHASLEAELDRMGDAHVAMVAAEERVAELIDASIEEAGVHMAEMDGAYYRVLDAIASIEVIFRRLQTADLDRQASFVRLIPWAEVLIAALIFAMVIRFVRYGQRIQREMHALSERTETRLNALVDERTSELEERNAQLRLAERLASIGTLAAGLGHDMNNVLFPVRCRLDALSSQALNPDVDREIQAVRSSLEYLQQLSDGLRLLAMNSDETGTTGGATELNAWWTEVEPLFRATLRRGATLTHDLQPGVPPVAVAPHRLTQAVFNLLVNAAEAVGAEGEIRLTTAHDTENDVVRLIVADDGEGMPAETLRRARDPYFTTKARGLSTGLGLPLVHGVARASGGTVEIESTPGEGTTVTMTIPIVVGAHADLVAVGRSVVLSLSDRRLATFIATLFKSAGFDVSHSDEQGIPDTDVWVLSSETATRDQASAFVTQSPTRRLIHIGEVPETWRDLGAICIDRAGGLGMIQNAIREVIETRQDDRSWLK